MTLASYLRTIHSKLEIWRSGEADAESWPTVSFIQAMSAFLMLSAASPHNHRLADVEWMLLLEEYTLEIYLGRTWMAFILTERGLPRTTLAKWFEWPISILLHRKHRQNGT
jgi:hypothetical protein